MFFSSWIGLFCVCIDFHVIDEVYGRREFRDPIFNIFPFVYRDKGVDCILWISLSSLT